MTCEKLFRTQREIYFWTFTFREVHSDWQYKWAWSYFMRSMASEFGGMILGVKVTEVHPGSPYRPSHGLHFHCLLNVRLPIAVLQRIGRKYGLGRMSVERADTDTVHYLAKYLTKRDAPKLMKGMRRWSTVGGFCGVKKNKVVTESVPVNCLRRFTLIFGQLSFKWTTLIYSYAKNYGDLSDWEFDTRRKFLHHAASICRHDTKTYWQLYRLVLSSYKSLAFAKRRVYELQSFPWHDTMANVPH